MASIATSDIVVPVSVANDIFHKAYQGSAIAQLSRREAQKFGQGKVMVLSGAPKAELVGEGADKSPTPATFTDVTVNPRKLHVTVRINDEVKWADEDYQLDVWNTIVEAAGDALGRALDLVGMHKINPLTGTVAASVTEGITDTTISETISGTNADQAIDAAAAKLIAAGYMPTGLAADPQLKWALASERDGNGNLLYPNIGIGLGEFSYRGIPAACSNTVSAPEISTGSGIVGFIGDFDAFRWGVQREIGVEVIEFGDPDGLGDLKRKNQIALRLEIVYGIGIVDTGAFAKILPSA